MKRARTAREMSIPVLSTLASHRPRASTVLFSLLAWLGGATVCVAAEPQTWAEKLGYGSGSILIRHADDGGMFPSGNAAIIDGMTASPRQIDSTSAMPPLHFFDEMAEWYVANPTQDVGLHLTFTSEWRNYKWGSSAPREMVRRILTKHGVFRSRELGVWFSRAPNTVGVEIQAQINRALVAMNLSLSTDPDRPEETNPCIHPDSKKPKYGPPPRTWELPVNCRAPSHVDSHMVSLYTRKVYFNKFVGRTLKNDLLPLTFQDFPATVDCLQSSVQADRVKAHWRRLEKAQKLFDESATWPYRRPWPRVDRYCKLEYGATYEATRDELKAFLQELSQHPGITQLLFHPAYESSLLEVSSAGWKTRAWDARLFADPEITPFFVGSDPIVQTTTWREMRQKCELVGICT